MVEVENDGNFFIGQYNHGVKVGKFTWYYNPVSEGYPYNYLYDCDGTRLETYAIEEIDLLNSEEHPYYYPLDIFTSMGLQYANEPYGIPLPFSPQQEVYDADGLCVMNTCHTCYRSLKNTVLNTCED